MSLYMLYIYLFGEVHTWPFKWTNSNFLPPKVIINAQFGWKLLPLKREWSFIWTKVNLLYQQGLSPFWVQSLIPYILYTCTARTQNGLSPMCIYSSGIMHKLWTQNRMLCAKLKMAHWFLTDRRTRQAILTFRNRWAKNVLCVAKLYWLEE